MKSSPVQILLLAVQGTSGPSLLSNRHDSCWEGHSAIAAGILLLCGGIWLGGHPETLPGPVRDAFVDDDRALRAEVVDSIKDNFYRPVKDSTSSRTR